MPDTIQDSEKHFTPDVWPRMRHRLVDIHETRLAEMDQHGVDVMILSLNAPAIQAIYETKRAIQLAGESATISPSRFLRGIRPVSKVSRRWRCRILKRRRRN